MLDWHSSQGLENIPAKQVEAVVRRELTQFSRGEHDIDRHIGDAILRASVFPASTYIDSIVTADFSRPVTISPGVKAIREELKKKAERYHRLKDAGIPFIVAIGSDGHLIDWHTVFTALYGDETVRITLRDDQIVGVEHSRLNYEGKITPGRQTPPVLTTVSAVWHIAWAMVENELIAQVVHFPNPWAANRVRIDGQDIIRVVFRRRLCASSLSRPSGCDRSNSANQTSCLWPTSVPEAADTDQGEPGR